MDPELRMNHLGTKIPFASHIVVDNGFNPSKYITDDGEGDGLPVPNIF